MTTVSHPQSSWVIAANQKEAITIPKKPRSGQPWTIAATREDDNNNEGRSHTGGSRTTFTASPLDGDDTAELVAEVAVYPGARKLVARRIEALEDATGD